MVVPVILAAGASSRMGSPKALCAFDGQTALGVILQTCRLAGAAAPIVVLGTHADEIQAKVDLAECRVVCNPSPERGQSSSLAVGLDVLPDKADAFLIFPVDVPLVAADSVRALLEAHRTGKHAIVALSYQGRRGHPILLAREFATPLRALREGGSARDVIKAHADKIFYVPTDDWAVATDMDTPEDYARMLAHWRSSPRTR